MITTFFENKLRLLINILNATNLKQKQKINVENHV